MNCLHISNLNDSQESEPLSSNNFKNTEKISLLKHLIYPLINQVVPAEVELV
jgi:hypothetical protein